MFFSCDPVSEFGSLGSEDLGRLCSSARSGVFYPNTQTLNPKTLNPKTLNPKPSKSRPGRSGVHSLGFVNGFRAVLGYRGLI